MAFRFRRSFRIAPGIRINVGSKSASVRVGPKTLGYTASTTGKKRVTASVPGTGISYSAALTSTGRSSRGGSPQFHASGSTRSFRGLIAAAVVSILATVLWFSSASDDRATGRRPESSARSATSDSQPGQPKAQERAFVTRVNVRLREGPSKSSKIVLTIPVGTEVISSGRQGEWHQVSYGTYSGWIIGNFLKVTDLDLETSASPTREASAAHTAPGRNAISGRASVIDGDTIEIAGTRVRFNGVDAPESSQLCKNSQGSNYRCGQAAAQALDAWLTKSQPVTCEFVEWDRYERFVGNCTRADGASIAAWLVAAGHAMDWPRHSYGSYARFQDEARSAKRGIWQGAFQPPWEWRAAGRTPAKPAASTDPAPLGLLSNTCNIKGNINSKGVRIYHIPGQRFYDETVISPRKGERMFCSEEEACAAGWRRSQR